MSDIVTAILKTKEAEATEFLAGVVEQFREKFGEDTRLIMITALPFSEDELEQAIDQLSDNDRRSTKEFFTTHDKQDWTGFLSAMFSNCSDQMVAHLIGKYLMANPERFVITFTHLVQLFKGVVPEDCSNCDSMECPHRSGNETVN